MRVFLNSPGFSYDVHSLVKAFYPEEDVKITSDGAPSDEDIIVFVSSGDIKKDRTYSGTIKVTAKSGSDMKAAKSSYDELGRSDIKSLLKRTVYESLSALSRKSLPWGTMTGIRPTKVPMKLIREGASDKM